MEVPKIAIRTYLGIKIISLSEIVYCKGDGRYTWIYLINGDSLISAKVLKIYEELLSDLPFVRIHKSCLINLGYVKSYDKRNGGNIIMENNHNLPVAKRRKKEFVERISEFFTLL